MPAEHMQVRFELAVSMDKAGDLPATGLNVHYLARAIGICAVRQGPVRAARSRKGAREKEAGDDEPVEHGFGSQQV